MKSHLSRGRMLRQRDQFLGLLADWTDMYRRDVLIPSEKAARIRMLDKYDPWIWMSEYLPKWNDEFESGPKLEIQWYEKMDRMIERLYPDFDYYWDEYEWDVIGQYELAWPEDVGESGYGLYHIREMEYREEEEWTAWWAKNN